MAVIQYERIGLADRVYARSIGLATRGFSERAINELMSLSNGDAHVLGQVRYRLESLTAENPGALGPKGALRLVTEVLRRAIAAGGVASEPTPTKLPRHVGPVARPSSLSDVNRRPCPTGRTSEKTRGEGLALDQ